MQPFNLNIPDSALEKLHQKLDSASFPDELESRDPWTYGTPLADIKRLTSYWKSGFDWRKVEAGINELPNYTTDISVDGFDKLNIHYIHQTSPTKSAIPLLFCHGWPGSFIEVRKLLPLLKGEGGSSPAFHVVAPSLPNYGFSEGVKKPGFALEQYAEVCHKLMLKLGYTEYGVFLFFTPTKSITNLWTVTQGGDWGFYITRALGLLYPDHVKASHVNMIRANPPEYKKNPLLAVQHAVSPYTEREKRGFERNTWFAKEGSGYNLEQRTKPQTIGYALADSPVALLAWIYEVKSQRQFCSASASQF
jgi:pimeloyl-ACP methyl ester carboxylesterase